MIIEYILSKFVSSFTSLAVFYDGKRKRDRGTHCAAGNDVAGGDGILFDEVSAIIEEDLLNTGVAGSSDSAQKSQIRKDRGRGADRGNQLTFPVETDNLLH